MKIAVLGTGMVGQTIASKLVELGHEVMMGSRTANNEKAAHWAEKYGSEAKHGTFEDAATFGTLAFNCTKGIHSLEALRMAGEKNLAGKILIDVANALENSSEGLPSLAISRNDSLGEQIQRNFPKIHVVKALNTLSCRLMVNPSLIPGDHNIFVCGNDFDSKGKVINFLVENFGWKLRNIIDLGDISCARGTESLLPIWLRLWSKYQHPIFNFHVVEGEAPKLEG